jgi:hypothetical protein
MVPYAGGSGRFWVARLGLACSHPAQVDHPLPEAQGNATCGFFPLNPFFPFGADPVSRERVSPRRVPISSYCSQVSITGAGSQAAESHILRGPVRLSCFQKQRG